MSNRDRTVKVFEIVYDGNGGSGPAGDGTFIQRFRGDHAELARAFAAKHTCYGRPIDPASVTPNDVPVRIAARWGMD